MSTYEALILMLTFGLFIVALQEQLVAHAYIDKDKK